MHLIEYIVAYTPDLARSFAEARAALGEAAYRDAPIGTRRPVVLDLWPTPDGKAARLRLPRGFDAGDKLAARLARTLPAATLRLYATAGEGWGYDAFGAGGDVACTFRSERARRGDEAAVLALWAGHGRAVAQEIEQLVKPGGADDGPAAVQALAAVLGVPYPTGELASPSFHVLLIPGDSP